MDSEKPPSLRSRFLTGFAGLLGAFVLYVLSIGPAGYVCVRNGIDPPFFHRFYTPAMWLMKNTLLREPLRRYDMWWTTLAIDHSNRHWPQTRPRRPEPAPLTTPRPWIPKSHPPSAASSPGLSAPSSPCCCCCIR